MFVRIVVEWFRINSDSSDGFGRIRTDSDEKYHTFRVLTLLDSYCTFTELSEISTLISTQSTQKRY